MRLVNFNFDTSIEIGVPGRQRFLDLHNCFDFQTISYFPEGQHISMLWTRSTGDWVQAELPKDLVIQFRGVSQFAASPRNPEIPFTEDSCLSAVTFTPPEFASNFTAFCEGYRSDSEHITFAFMSGFAVKIWAKEAELFTDPK
jgi:hypothetical protein